MSSEKAERNFILFDDSDFVKPTRAEIKNLGYYPLMSLKILDNTREKAIADNIENELQKHVRRLLNCENIGNRLNIKDRSGAEHLMARALKKAIHSGMIEFRNCALKDFGFCSLEKLDDRARENVTLLRRIVRTIIENENLLDMCVNCSDDDTRNARAKAILCRTLQRLNINMDPEALVKFVKVFLSLRYGIAEYDLTLHYRDFNDPGGENEYKRNLYVLLCEYADSYFQSIYLARQLFFIRRFLREFFSDIYCEFPLKLCLHYLPTKMQRKRNEMIIRMRAEENAAFYGNEKCWIIKVLVANDLKNVRNYEKETTILSHYNESRLKNHPFVRRTVDFVSVLHEYAHGIFSHLTGEPSAATALMDWSRTCHRVLSEGFAVFVEQKCIDYIINHAQELGIVPEDMIDFRLQKLYRELNLRHYENRIGEIKLRIKMLSDPGLCARLMNDMNIMIETMKNDYFLSQHLDYLRMRIKVLEKTGNQEDEIEAIREEIEIYNDPLTRQQYLEDTQFELARLQHRQERQTEIKDLEDMLDCGAGPTYIEGIRFYNDLYRHHGFEGVSMFVKNLNSKKSIDLKRDSELYKKFIQKPMVLVKYLMT